MYNIKAMRLLWLLIFCICAQFTAFAREIPITFRLAPDRPFFESEDVMIDSAEYNTLVLKMSSQKNGTGRLFWANSYDMRFNQPKSIWFTIQRGEKNYYFNIPSQNPNWVGWARKFLLYPETNYQNIETISARAVKGNLMTNFASGWQEFWGPKGRLVIGSTINLTPASMIFGRPINVYIYWLTGIIFLAAFAWKRSYYAAGRFAIYFALAAWALLGINADINYLNIFRDNFSKYFGKSIEQKQAVAYGREYYDFLVFAKEKLPKESVKFGVLSRRYAPELQARIFLVPHVLTDPASPEVSYLLAFDPDPEQISQLQGFQTFARLDKNAFILKREK